MTHTRVDMFTSPSGYTVILRHQITPPQWVVRILNFATWKHLTLGFVTEAEARTELDRWRL